MAALSQISQCGAHADSVGVVHWDGAHASRFRVVHVWVVGMTQSAEAGIERILGRQPSIPLVAAHRDGSFRAVEIVMDVCVGLQFSQVGENVGEAPLVVAHGGPCVVVLRNTAQQHLAIDGAGASHHPASGHRDGCSLLRCGVALE